MNHKHNNKNIITQLEEVKEKQNKKPNKNTK